MPKCFQQLKSNICSGSCRYSIGIKPQHQNSNIQQALPSKSLDQPWWNQNNMKSTFFYCHNITVIKAWIIQFPVQGQTFPMVWLPSESSSTYPNVVCEQRPNYMSLLVTPSHHVNFRSDILLSLHLILSLQNDLVSLYFTFYSVATTPHHLLSFHAGLSEG